MDAAAVIERMARRAEAAGNEAAAANYRAALQAAARRDFLARVCPNRRLLSVEQACRQETRCR